MRCRNNKGPASWRRIRGLTFTTEQTKEKTLKITIVGAGAMGSVYAGLLAEAGNEVWIVDLWQEHVDAIKANGLHVTGASGDRTIRTINATTDIADAGNSDLFIVATKASGVASAAAAIAPHLGGDTLVLTIQNGLGAGERICEHMPAESVLLGVAGGFGASIPGAGKVHHNGMQLIRIGELNGGITPRAERVAEVWQQAGFNVRCFGNINQLIWEKFICNVTFSGPCTVFGRPIGGVMGDPHAWHIALTCAREAWQAAVAQQIPLSFDNPDDYVKDFGAAMPAARPSMLLDHLARRPSEIDAINGMVPVVAAKAGTSAPYNEVLTGIIRSREEEFRNGD